MSVPDIQRRISSALLYSYCSLITIMYTRLRALFGFVLGLAIAMNKVKVNNYWGNRTVRLPIVDNSLIIAAHSFASNVVKG